MYYIILALLEIGMFLSENWKGLTATALASGIGVILGKRLGVRIAVNYFMKTFGLERKSITEHKLDWLLEQERKRGGIWVAPISKRYKVNIRLMLFKCFILSRMARSIARYTKQHTNLRRKKMSRKLLMMLFGAIVMVLSQFGINLDPETIIGMGTLIISAIIGQAVVDTNGVGQYAPLKEKFKSKKLWTALGGSVLIMLNDYYALGVSTEVIYWIVGLGVTFILGKSAVSVVQASKNGSIQEKPKSDPKIEEQDTQNYSH